MLDEIIDAKHVKQAPVLFGGTLSYKRKLCDARQQPLGEQPPSVLSVEGFR